MITACGAGSEKLRNSCLQLVGITPGPYQRETQRDLTLFSGPCRGSLLRAHSACPSNFPFSLFLPDLCLTRLPRPPIWQVPLGSQEGRPDWRAQTLQKLLYFPPGLSLCCGVVLVLQGQKPRGPAGQPLYCLGSLRVLETKASTPLSSQGPSFPLALPSHVSTLSSARQTPTVLVRVFL